jgi:putative membrane protein insertion efficiency factor
MTVRDLAWRIGAPARAAAIGAIRLYRVTLAGWLGGQCRFAPTCSHYAELAIREHGAVRGAALAMWRVGRCNPYGAGGLDPVPPSRSRGGRSRPRAYDSVVHRPGEAGA